jgi:nucleotide sugar dehydrogenase
MLAYVPAKETSMNKDQVSIQPICSTVTENQDKIKQVSQPGLVVVIGVGYVGLELVKTFSRNYRVIGFDISSQRIEFLSKNEPLPNVTYQTHVDGLKGAELYLVSTTTLLTTDGNIDLKYVKAAIENVSSLVEPWSSVCLESSIAVGTTRMLCSHLREKNVYVGFSPERVDPGRILPKGHEIPKVISGIDLESLSTLTRLYSKVYDRMVPVSSLETAEMTKLFENCFRMINIAYVNEMADNCTQFQIDPYEVIDAASTKPFGYMPFNSGIGVGGSCIPVNPYYLFTNCQFPLLQKCTETMESRPKKLANEHSKILGKDKTILVCGIAFKPGEKVLTYSKNLEFASALAKNHTVHVYDPNVDDKFDHLVRFEFVDEEEGHYCQFQKFDNIVMLFPLEHFPRKFSAALPFRKISFFCRV